MSVNSDHYMSVWMLAVLSVRAVIVHCVYGVDSGNGRMPG